MKAGTVGNCSKSGCHSSTSTASGCFNYVTGRGYTPALMVDPNQSPFTWFGGNMPVNGGANAAAAKDFNAWYAAGGKNN
jgi:hypothetical protein